ncbi:MAG: phenylacetate-CoA ligase [archaeon GW2011_AR3]|nr:MAG: phenylacetate-CoA ligase [archaeon GW2011_AR3]MBS3109979.1 phenylacetate--CoA ligase family protein [Candidatus Woesearchaeota archaeon]
MNEKISRFLFYPIWELISSRSTVKFYTTLRNLEKTQWLDKKELEKVQEVKLFNLLKHAYKNVPYYTHLFDKLGIKPQNIKKKEDLQKLPILTKELIRENFQDLLARNRKPNSYQLDHTGGSTGKVLDFYRDLKSREYALAINRRFWRWAGYDIGTKILRIWGSPSDINKYDNIRTRLHFKLTNSMILNSFEMGETQLGEYAEKFQEFRPKIVHGYANAVYLFAQYIDKNKLAFNKPKSVITTSEKLYPYQRKLIERVFGCKVFEEYGCREMDLIAHECESHDGMHVANEKYILEFMYDGNHKTSPRIGSIILTDLENYAMPFIRYKNEDMASLMQNDCRCGRKLDKISYITGRITDFLIGTNGNRVSGAAVTPFFAKLRGINEFRIVQEHKDVVRVMLVRSKTVDPTISPSINKFLKKFLGDRMHIKLEFCRKIPKLKSGKMRIIINEMRGRRT